MIHLPSSYFDQRKLEHIVENRTTYTVNNAELNVYETHHFAEEIVLQFNQPVLASMIDGKKIMHVRDLPTFDFLPGQSLIMPANEIMKIDFPEADEMHPTRCLAMTISPEKIKNIIAEMNRQLPRADNQLWQASDTNFSFTNDLAIAQIIQRLTFLFAENHPSKDYFVDMTLRELIIRVMQTENRTRLTQNANNLKTSNRLAAVIQHIRTHLSQELSINDLSEQACMSASNFHKVFKREMGMSPTQFINEQRIAAATEMLKIPGIQIKEVYLACGFTNQSYFMRTFKKIMKQTPGQFQSHWWREE